MAMVIIFATTAVFVGCEKKENPVVEQRKDALKKQKLKLGFYFVQATVDRNFKKVGSIGNKVCVTGDKTCRYWFRQELKLDWGFYIGLHTNEKKFEADEVVSAIPSDPEPENRNFPKRILFEYPNEWNNASALDRHFEGRYDFFVLEDAMAEGEESLLAEMLGVDFPCIIKAGEYPMYMNGEGNYVVELMVERLSLDFNFWGTAIKLKIGDQDQLSSTYSGYSEFSEVSSMTGHVIYAEFLREWNDNPNAINIMESIRAQGGLDVNEDIIVDEDPYLFEVFPYSCVIRAGRYPVLTEDGENYIIAFAVEPL